MFTTSAIANTIRAEIVMIARPVCVMAKPETGHGRQADTAGTGGTKE